MDETTSNVQPDSSLGLRDRPLRRTKTAVVVAQKLVEEITSEGRKPGDKLPPEKEMLQRYAVGRGTLRESLRFLEMNGVITVKPGPGGGPVVATPDARDLASTLGLFLELQNTRFDAIVQVREVLEPAIAGLAAERQDRAMIAAIGHSVQSMNDNISDLDRFLLENERFHHLVAAAAGNPVFALLVGSFDAISDGERFGISFPLERRKVVASVHQTIYEAIESGDAERAISAMRDHVKAFALYVNKRHPEAAASKVRWRDVAP
jgi:GntR family transcriptional repressor for pyruvate dehydrogenase complex